MVRGFVIALAATVVGAGLAVGEDRPKAVEVVKHLDIPYRDDADADKTRHRLDLYLPKGQKDFPVLFFVHGGSWTSGKKELYTALGSTFAKLGIGVVVTNYRLSPQIKHPGHIEDVARSFAWTHANIARYGGDPKRIVACGHSAGGHLVSLLATDSSYLKANKLALSDIHGVVGISGVYRIYSTEKVFQVPFGKVEKDCLAASPITHVTGKHPPFLLAYADKDLPALDKMAEEMDAALKKKDCTSSVLKVSERDHISIIVKIIDGNDKLQRSIVDFVKK